MRPSDVEVIQPLEVVEGMQVAERMEAVLENPVILIHEKKISAMNDLLPVLELVARASRPLLIIAEDIDGEGVGDDRRHQAARHFASGRGEGAPNTAIAGKPCSKTSPS